MVYCTRSRIGIYLMFFTSYLILLVDKFIWNCSPDILASYGADFLFMPLTTVPCWIATKWITKQNGLFLASILLNFILVTIVFEVILPNYSTEFVADVYDVLAYGVGGFVTYLIFGKKK